MPIANPTLTRFAGFGALTALGEGFVKWWLSGLRDTVPSRWREWAAGEGRPQVTLWRDADDVICRLASATGPAEITFPCASFNASALEQWLTGQGLTREATIVAPVISRELFFQRELNVPKAATSALPGILDQDILRRTPFQLGDIWHAATAIAEPVGDIVPMCHWIVRRDWVETALSAMGLTSRDVDHLAVTGLDGKPVTAIVFRAAGNDDPAWALRAIRLLAVAALGAVLLGLIAFEWRQASVEAGLEAAISEARHSAHASREAMDPMARLFAMKAEPGILDVWDELSRILPDHTFLTEIRVAEGTVVLSGFSSDAAHLVRIIDQSPLFSRATLTAAITPDANEHKDRFSIQFGLRSAPVARSAT